MTVASLIPGMVGAIIGFCGALLLSVVARWREDEKSRSETRTMLTILISEIEHRYGILMNRYANVDLSHDSEVGDLVKRLNRHSSGVTFNFAEEMKPYDAAFGAMKDRLGAIGPEVAVSVWRHYTTMNERLLAHDNELDAMGGDQEMADAIRASLRAETKALITSLRDQLAQKSSRAFFGWLPLWILGKS